MNNVDIIWQDMPEAAWKPAAEAFVRLILAHLQYDNWDIAVVFCFDPFIRQLNKTYRNIDAPTDVLSFEQGDEYDDAGGQRRFSAGDIIISLDSLKTNAENFNVAVDEELKRLLIHGILHLSGMDHSDNSPEQEMLQLQEKILGIYSTEAVIRNRYGDI
ncbi:MAG: rRNA maturation RNase YbeY [Treponema sp.]